MTWTTPRTWATNELVTAALMNEQLRVNLSVLKDPPSTLYRYTPGTPFSTTSTTFVDINSSLNFNLTTNGGALMIGLAGRVYHNPGIGTDCYIDLNINGASAGGANGIYWLIGPNTFQFPFSVVWLTAPLTAGSQTIKVQIRRGSGNTNAVQVYEILAWVREVS
jgi:hypothetical protein